MKKLFHPRNVMGECSLYLSQTESDLPAATVDAIMCVFQQRSRESFDEVENTWLKHITPTDSTTKLLLCGIQPSADDHPSAVSHREAETFAAQYDMDYCSVDQTNLDSVCLPFVALVCRAIGSQVAAQATAWRWTVAGSSLVNSV